VTTVDGYLPLGSTPSNLTIRCNLQVADVVFDGERACGVQLVDGTHVEAGWVVLCAGTYGSPPMLMRSGIGPAAHLQSIGVPVRVDLPGVGANLADHPSVDVDFGYGGPAAGGPVLHAIATFHSSLTSPDRPPDLMFWLSDPEGDPPGAGIGVVLLKPQSRGVVRLRSANPAEPPSIALPSLTDRRDLERLAEGYRLALEVANHPAVRRLCSVDPTAAPRDDDELYARIRAELFSVPHVVGTCAMGSRPEDGAVVDASLRVHGTERLSVVDASVMPDVPSGFTHIPTIMIAERSSEQLAALL
jgi:choline dehydrogenase